MSPFWAFHTCRERIRRAETHYQELTRTWNEFIEDVPYSVFLDIKDDGRGRIFVECEYRSFPDQFSLEFGEMLYQLRAALDACTYGAVVQHTGQDPPPNKTNLGFPLCTTKKTFQKKIKRARQLRDLPKTCRDIIEAVQPYRRFSLEPDMRVWNFNHSLRLLNEWSSQDRHHGMHILGSLASDIRPRLHLPEGCSLIEVRPSRDGLLKDNRPIAHFRLAGFQPGMKVQVTPNLVIDMALEDARPRRASNDTLVNRIRSMFRAVRVIASNIEDTLHDPPKGNDGLGNRGKQGQSPIA